MNASTVTTRVGPREGELCRRVRTVHVCVPTALGSELQQAVPLRARVARDSPERVDELGKDLILHDGLGEVVAVVGQAPEGQGRRLLDAAGGRRQEDVWNQSHGRLVTFDARGRDERGAALTWVHCRAAAAAGAPSHPPVARPRYSEETKRSQHVARGGGSARSARAGWQKRGKQEKGAQRQHGASEDPASAAIVAIDVKESA